MNLSNDAFVKTFSRRNRSASDQQAIQHREQPTVASAVGSSAANHHDPSITRIDAAESVSPAAMSRSESSVASPVGAGSDPRLVQQIATQQRDVSLQHTHTAYAAGQTAAPAHPLAAPNDNPPTTSPGQQPLNPTLTDPITERFDEGLSGPPSPHSGRAARLQSQPTIDSDAPSDRRVASPLADSARIQPFQAVWEVDVFDVPARVADLFFERRRYQQIADRMSEAVKTGLQSILITSVASGEGRSSVAIGMAMAAAASGIRVALVDADTESPTLADDLRLDLQYSWIETVRGGLPVKEVAVHAVEDGVTLIPLLPPVGSAVASAHEATELIDSLKSNFDLLLIDGPASDSNTASILATAVETAIVVRDISRTDAAAIARLHAKLCRAGVQGVGVVDNFV